MSEEELIETLRAFEKNRVEQLEEPAKNLFYAIMEIADERDRLNNIINELEKYLRNEEAEYDRLYEEQDEQEYLDKYFATRNVLNKLQELKGSDKEWKIQQ